MSPSNRFSRRPVLSLVLVWLVLLGLGTGLYEATLRFMGFVPGQVFRSYLLTPTDSLRLFQGYEVDSTGVFKVSGLGREVLAACIGLPQALPAALVRRYPDVEYSLLKTASDFHPAVWQSDTISPFALLAQRVTQTATTDSFDLAIRAYLNNPVNEHGFKSIPFWPLTGTGRKRILLLGDSFGWGYSAQPLYNGFADRLLAQGYVVYNTGIPCADPAQYEAVARQWIARLKPDVVLVCYFVGNDGMTRLRKTGPERWLYYPTNAGWLNAQPDSVYLTTPAQAYRFAHSALFMPRGTTVQWLLGTTCVGTKLWYALARLTGTVPPEMLWYDAQRFPASGMPNVAEHYLLNIRAEAQRNRARFVAGIIPEYLLLDPEKIRQKMNFRSLSYTLPMGLTPEHYSTQRDAHLNNRGMELFTSYLVRLLERPDSGAVAPPPVP